MSTFIEIKKNIIAYVILLLVIVFSLYKSVVAMSNYPEFYPFLDSNPIFDFREEVNPDD